MNAATGPVGKYYQPATEYKKEDHCSICVSKFAEKEVSVTTCAHHFHTSCLQTWLTHGDICPLCRTPLNERATQPEDSIFHRWIQAVRASLQEVEAGGSRSSSSGVNVLVVMSIESQDEFEADFLNFWREAHNDDPPANRD